MRLPCLRPAGLFQRNLHPPRCGGRGINISGVDFWHAVEFSRNGRFLRTHPLGLSSGRFPSVLLFCLCCCLTFPTLPDPFSVPFPVGIHFRWPVGRPCLFDCLVALFRRVRLYQKFSTGLTGRSIPELSGGAPLESNSRELTEINCRRRTCPALGNCSNLPPHSSRVNGFCGARRRLAAWPVRLHIRPRSVRRHCAPPPRRHPSRRPAPRDRQGRRRKRERPVRRLCLCRCGPRSAGRRG